MQRGAATIPDGEVLVVVVVVVVEEAAFIRDSVTNEDPPNAHQAQHRPVQATGAMSA